MMKRLVSKHDEGRKKKRNQVIIGIVLVLVMSFSIVGFALQSSLGTDNGGSNEGQVTYNGIVFTFSNGFWVAGDFVFRYNPYEIESLLTGNLENIKDASSYQNAPLYIYSESSEAETEVRVNLGQVAERVNSACIEGYSCIGNSPVKSCSDGDNLLIIKESPEKIVKQEGSCVFIEGPMEELLALTDGFLFRTLGVM